MLVGKRRRLLDYLMRKDINRYRAIIAQKELGIRNKRADRAKTVQGRTPTQECGLLFIQKVSPIYRLFSTFLPGAIQRK